MTDETAADKPRCINLSCKAMLVYGEAFQEDPEYQEGQTDFWCLCTSKGQGPDGAEATLTECSNPQRTCFQEY